MRPRSLTRAGSWGRTSVLVGRLLAHRNLEAVTRAPGIEGDRGGARRAEAIAGHALGVGHEHAAGGEERSLVRAQAHLDPRKARAAPLLDAYQDLGLPAALRQLRGLGPGRDDDLLVDLLDHEGGLFLRGALWPRRRRMAVFEDARAGAESEREGKHEGQTVRRSHRFGTPILPRGPGIDRGRPGIQRVPRRRLVPARPERINIVFARAADPGSIHALEAAMTPPALLTRAARIGLSVAAALAFLAPLATRITVGSAFYLTGSGK